MRVFRISSTDTQLDVLYAALLRKVVPTGEQAKDGNDTRIPGSEAEETARTVNGRPDIKTRSYALDGMNPTST